MSRLCSRSIPVLGVRCALSEQNDCGENEVQTNVNDDRRPYQHAEAFGEIEHENVGANAQLYQGHSV
jgi:hypothetical protein